MPDYGPIFLPPEDCQRILDAYRRARGEQHFDQSEAERILRRAFQSRLEAACLENVLEGLMNVHMEDRDLVFTLTEEGRRVAEGERGEFLRSFAAT